jgi:hypothetical protein
VSTLPSGSITGGRGAELRVQQALGDPERHELAARRVEPPQARIAEQPQLVLPVHSHRTEIGRERLPPDVDVPVARGHALGIPVVIQPVLVDGPEAVGIEGRAVDPHARHAGHEAQPALRGIPLHEAVGTGVPHLSGLHRELLRLGIGMRPGGFG